jgi:hypothetical protein
MIRINAWTGMSKKHRSCFRIYSIRKDWRRKMASSKMGVMTENDGMCL